MPTSRIESASAANASSSKCSRGCCGFGRISVVAISASPAAFSATVPVGIKAPRPLPSPPGRATTHLLGQLAVRQGSTRRRVENRDGLPERRRLGYADRPGDNRPVHLRADVGADFALDLLGELG